MDNSSFKIKNIRTEKWFWEQDEFSFLNKPRSDYGILSVEKGRVDYIIGNKTITLEKGSFIYLPKNSLYKARFHINEGDVKTLLVNFDLEEGSGLPLPEFYHGRDEALQLEAALKRLCELGDEEEDLYLKYAYFYLCFHIMHSSYIHSRNSVDTRLIAHAKELLRGEKLSVEEIAEELKISSSGFRKKFREATGRSPNEWRNERKIEAAKRLLVTSDLSIDEIAEKTGFYDTPYFYKKFFSLVGMTPKKYRESENMF